MPSPFQGIEIAGRALRAFQYGLDVAGHNVANVNTPGYSRQVVDYGPTDPTRFWMSRAMNLGTGVTLASVNRIQDMFLQARMVAAQGNLGRFEAFGANAAQIEAMLLEPGSNGISAALDRFFNAWSGLAANPGEPAARLEVQQAGNLLAGRIRGTYTELSSMEARAQTEIEGTVARINELTAEIARLNSAIRGEVAMGASPNDLLDQRDLALQRLGKLLDVQVHPQSDGSVWVYMGSLSLVDSGGSRAFPQAFDPATYSVNDGSLSHGVRSGTLLGLFETLNAISARKSQLDALANNLRSEVNALHRTGTNPNGTTDVPFFAETAIPPTTGAVDFALSQEVLTDPNNVSAGTTRLQSDGGLALSLSQLRESAIAGLGGATFGAYYSNLLTSIAADASTTKNHLATQTAVVQQIEAQRQSTSGVSLDEEMANMLRLQRSYQAAAKALSLFDQVSEDLINLIR